MSLKLPNTGIREFVADLAKKHNVEYIETNYSALARQISRLSDAEVAPDETEKLVIALRQAKVIDGPTMVALLGRYFDELNVTPR
ncbi:hypothetical protein [Caballeronia sp. ATUFL_F1_KS39]|uniref:hypothetical protein n=1 Tax=Caballeronia sp. ATUFL_F1_KS39 TaxID=2921766 RepID=UPI00202940C0|nr:hypothetical protein [Caballeronia sp. ATUFL_F1_KS39]